MKPGGSVGGSGVGVGDTMTMGVIVGITVCAEAGSMTSSANVASRTVKLANRAVRVFMPMLLASRPL